MGREGWDPSQLLQVAKEAPVRRPWSLHASGVCCGRGDVSSVADMSHIPLGLHSKSRDDVPASLLPSALSPACCSLCPTVPKGGPHLGFSCFPHLPGAGSASGLCRQAPGSLASCQKDCLPARTGLPARSITSQPAAGGAREASTCS